MTKPIRMPGRAMRERHRREKKKAYETRELAETHLRFVEANIARGRAPKKLGGMQPYVCLVCGKWHVGH